MDDSVTTQMDTANHQALLSCCSYHFDKSIKIDAIVEYIWQKACRVVKQREIKKLIHHLTGSTNM